MIVKKNGDNLWISFNYDPRLVVLVKSLIGRVYNPREKCWQIPIAGSYASVTILRRAGFIISDDVMRAVIDEESRERDLKRLQETEGVEMESALPLYSFQKVGVEFMVRSGGCLNAFEPGLGKTLCALATCERVKADRVLVLAPKSTIYQWQGEIRRWLGGDRNAVVVFGDKKERGEIYDSIAQKASWFLVMGYETFRIDEIANKWRFDVVIIDEAQKLGNPRTKLYKAIMKIRSDKKYALSGTPIMNRAMDIWGIINAVRPGVLGGYYQFIERYCKKDHWGGIVGYQNMDELRDRIQNFMIRKTMNEVGLELPEKTIIDIPFVLAGKEKELYQKIREELLFEIDKALLSKIENPVQLQNTIVKMTRLQQLSDSMELIGDGTESSKLEILKEKLEEVLIDGQKAIIFSRFSTMCKILKRELSEYQPAMITGDIETKARAGEIKRFDGDEKCRVLISSEAGGAGLNIQRANVVIHYDLPYSVGKYEQRNGRSYRIGQKRHVTVYNLLAKGTIDMAVKNILYKKRELSADLLDNPIRNLEQIKELLCYETRD